MELWIRPRTVGETMFHQHPNLLSDQPATQYPRAQPYSGRSRVSLASRSRVRLLAGDLGTLRFSFEIPAFVLWRPLRSSAISWNLWLVPSQRVGVLRIFWFRLRGRTDPRFRFGGCRRMP